MIERYIFFLLINHYVFLDIYKLFQEKCRDFFEEKKNII